MSKVKSDGSTASYYVLPLGATQLQDLISHKDMNAQIGEIFRACYRYGEVSHSDRLRDAKKIKFYAEAEIARLEKLNDGPKATCKHGVPVGRVCSCCPPAYLNPPHILPRGCSDGELKEK